MSLPKKNLKRIGVLGGTFDPPHLGHLEISKFAIRKLKLKFLIWAVTKKNPLKNLGMCFKYKQLIVFDKILFRKIILLQTLINIACTNKGPICLEEIEPFYLDDNDDLPLQVYSIDKFPPLLNYMAPSGVRVADGSRVRLGAYLASGTTVMHEGFINFNAGTLGPAMIEGRISAGVVVGEHSDLGGGSSTMGTLSGGNNVKISVGKRCLLGANSGLGIPLGDDCIIEAGLYLTSGSKVSIVDENKIVKASELSGKSNLIFRRNSLTGQVEAVQNKKSVKLNEELHKN